MLMRAKGNLCNQACSETAHLLLWTCWLSPHADLYWRLLGMTPMDIGCFDDHSIKHE